MGVFPLNTIVKNNKNCVANENRVFFIRFTKQKILDLTIYN